MIGVIALACGRGCCPLPRAQTSADSRSPEISYRMITLVVPFGRRTMPFCPACLSLCAGYRTACLLRSCSFECLQPQPVRKACCSCIPSSNPNSPKKRTGRTTYSTTSVFCAIMYRETDTRCLSVQRASLCMPGTAQHAWCVVARLSTRGRNLCGKPVAPESQISTTTPQESYGTNYR